MLGSPKRRALDQPIGRCQEVLIPNVAGYCRKADLRVSTTDPGARASPSVQHCGSIQCCRIEGRGFQQGRV